MTETITGRHVISGADLGPQLHVSIARYLAPLDPAIENSALTSTLMKPRGGFWTSTYREGTSGWVEWCRAEDFGGVDDDDARWWLLQPAADARILAIDGLMDLRAALDAYGVAPEIAMYDGDRALDFARIRADGFAAVHLTERGNDVLHLPMSFEGPHMNSWDCESTCWLRWAFTGEPVNVKEVA